MKLDAFKWPLSPVLLLVAIVIALAARWPAPASPAPAPAPEETPKKPPVLETRTDPERIFGFIRSLYVNEGAVFLAIDEAQFIENRDPGSQENAPPGPADLAAIEDGACGLAVAEARLGLCARNGFYIRNNSVSTTALALDRSATVTLLAQSAEGVRPRAVSIHDFQTAFLRPKNGYDDPYYALVEGPYLLTLKKGRVIKLESRYIP